VLLERGVVYVSRQPLIDKPTKTRSNHRLALDAGTVELLRAHRERSEQVARELGLTLSASAYVFSREPDGSRPLAPSLVSHQSRAWPGLATKARRRPRSRQRRGVRHTEMRALSDTVSQVTRMGERAPRGVLYVIVCAAPPAAHVQDLVKLAQADGWEVAVTASGWPGSPTRSRWVRSASFSASMARSSPSPM
jgi:hypothetical protein